MWLGGPIKTINIIVIFVCTDWGTGALSSWKIHSTDYFRIMYLTELIIFPSTSVIEQTPFLPIHPKTSQTYGCSHYDFHTVQSIACSTFSKIFSKLHTHDYFHTTACISSENIIWSHCSCILQSSLCRHHHTWCVSFFYNHVLQALSMYAHLACS